MLCGYPVSLSGGTVVACGQCMNCRVNRKRFWVGRILAEAIFHPQASSFWTLTYAEECVPTVGSGMFADAYTLRAKALANFFKRWRVRKPAKEVFRYFAVGEYGDKKGRPHYHVCAFGPRLDITLEDRVSSCWSSVLDGDPPRVEVAELLPERAAYCAGYTVKKLRKDDVEGRDGLLPGQEDEFFRVSRKPPLGAAFISHMADAHFTLPAARAMAMSGDVLKEFRVGNRRYPIGRYWVQWLRSQLNVPTPPAEDPYERYEDYDERVEAAKGRAQKLFRQYRARKRSPDF